MKQAVFDGSIEITPLDLIDIFYDEALKIAPNDDEAMKLTNETVADFLSHYKITKGKGE